MSGEYELKTLGKELGVVTNSLGGNMEEEEAINEIASSARLEKAEVFCPDKFSG